MSARKLLIAVITLVALIAPRAASAHPLGNFSISQYSALRVSQNAITLRYIIDMAEIPTFQAIQENGIATKADEPSVQEYLARRVEALRERLLLEINGDRLSLQIESKTIIFPPGAGGLPTLKIGVVYKADLPDHENSGQYALTYRDGNFAGRAGWKEVVAVSESGARILNSSVPATDRSAELSDYPTDLLNSPPQQLDARVEFTLVGAAGPAASGKATDAASRIESTGAANVISHAGGESGLQPPTDSAVSNHAKDGRERPLRKEAQTLAPAPPPKQAGTGDQVQLEINKQATPRDSFTELVASPELGWSIVLIALAVAVGLGAFHALEPGHGKTLVAAYLVGSRGTMKHALLLGLIVTAAHTAGVYLLGGITLYASQYIVPERLYPWLGVTSGVMITILGTVLFIRHYRSEGMAQPHHHHAQGHSHDHVHGHSHHGHDHHHETASLRELLTLGISGGIIPCPAALVVLLSAVSMNRIGFGLLLIVAFSAGLAAVLIAIGLLMVYARQFMSRFQGDGQLMTRWLPLASSFSITLFGIALSWQAIQSVGLIA